MDFIVECKFLDHLKLKILINFIFELMYHSLYNYDTYEPYKLPIDRLRSLSNLKAPNKLEI